MARIKYVKPEEAEGKVKEAYSYFPEHVGVPKPIQMMSASPDIMSIQMQMMGYFMNHKTLDFTTLSFIRLIVASREGFGFCKHLNTQLLTLHGATPEELEATIDDPMKAPVEDKEKAIIAFAVAAVTEPDSITDEHMENLRQLGYTDSDIYDAATHASSMIVAGRLYKAFNMDEE